MLKNFAMIFGVILIIVGILGAIPSVTPGGYLLGLFHVNLEHNLVHLFTGIISLICGLLNEKASRFFFQIFGILYGLIALLGFYYVDRPIFGMIANNMADVFLHILIAAISLYLGFFYRPSHPKTKDQKITD